LGGAVEGGEPGGAVVGDVESASPVIGFTVVGPLALLVEEGVVTLVSPGRFGVTAALALVSLLAPICALDHQSFVALCFGVAFR